MSSPPAETPTSKPAPSSSGATNFEFEPPVACVRRVLKASLPSSTNTSKDAIAAFTRGVGIFVIYLTTCANDVAKENKRQTITAADVLKAVKELDFEEFTPELKTFLENYRANEKSKKEAKSKAAAKRSVDDATNDEDNSQEGEPAAKKPRTELPESVEVTTEAAVGGEQDDTKKPAANEGKETD